ncbi:MAG: prepilin peptidase [Alphaproteobacteria bacterium]|jgi:prepilin peptidase CpaA|nr:prepilin peptidase [Alphaproteobacteria bacterium]
MVTLMLSLVFPVVMVLAMVTDLRTFEIPNRLTLVLVLAYPLAALSAGFAWQQILWAFALAVMVLLAGIVMFVLKIMGGGDGKLMAAAALWTGQELISEFLAITALAGGLLALTLLLYRRMPLSPALSELPTLSQLHEKKQDVPYAIAIGIAGLAIYPQVPLVNV